jgi:predicted 3-demethylubiquinone-9 3-methyltransferase (glyoxalase superfamily)
MQKTVTFLMFVGDKNGKAEEAVNFYVSLFKNSEVISLEKYKEGEGETVGNVKQAMFTIDGLLYRAMDSGADHKFNFTPSMSIFINCETEEEIDKLYKKLSEGGEVLMELMDYGFSKKFAWVNDKYGVSWQMNLQ